MLLMQIQHASPKEADAHYFLNETNVLYAHKQSDLGDRSFTYVMSLHLFKLYNI